MSEYCPNRGDVVWLEFNPQLGHEQAGKRPALVISQAAYNKKVGLALFYPITSQVKGYPFEVKINLKRINGVVLADQIKSLDWRARRIEFIEVAPEEILEKSNEKLGWLLE
ncbi:MAG: endoribonuclease MazF [Spirochaetaceae bacterium]|nr:MAG: endoribonuclease MazF [Spirochaetaceae bacterium]